MKKPTVDLSHYWLSPNPSKNYLFHLLRHHIAEVNPSRSLDAGVGELRNFWMFPGHYCGISHNRQAFFRGLTRGYNPDRIRAHGPPEVYLMRLERDFSFLGTFDLCVCTQTIAYVQNQIDVLMRLSALVRQGGSLIIESEIGRLDEYLEVIQSQYENIETIYWGYEGCNYTQQGMPKLANMTPRRSFTEHTYKEMNARNVRAGHAYFYLYAQKKRRLDEPTKYCSRPEMLEENGLFIVKEDIPHLKMTD